MAPEECRMGSERSPGAIGNGRSSITQQGDQSWNIREDGKISFFLLRALCFGWIWALFSLNLLLPVTILLNAIGTHSICLHSFIESKQGFQGSLDPPYPRNNFFKVSEENKKKKN